MPFKDIEKKKAHDKTYSIINKDKLKAYKMFYYLANKDKVNAKSKLYNIVNKDKIRIKHKIRYLANREEGKMRQKTYYLANKDKIREYKRKYRRDNLEKIRVENRKREALKLGNSHELYTDTYIFERDNYVCGICGQKINKKLKWPHPRSKSIDHILAISKGGADAPINLQAAHLRCNTGKNAQSGGQLRLIG